MGDIIVITGRVVVEEGGDIRVLPAATAQLPESMVPTIPLSKIAPLGTEGQVPKIVGGELIWGTDVTGVTDHGALSGLSDNDHPQYALAAGLGTAAAADSGDFATASHAHAESDVTGLTAALAGKAAASHAHAQSDITGLTTVLAAKVDAAAAVFTGPVQTKGVNLTGPDITGALEPGVTYWLDLTGGAITKTGPAIPVFNDTIKVRLRAGDPAVNNATICGHVLDASFTGWIFEYDGAAWQKFGG